MLLTMVLMNLALTGSMIAFAVMYRKPRLAFVEWLGVLILNGLLVYFGAPVLRFSNLLFFNVAWLVIFLMQLWSVYFMNDEDELPKKLRRPQAKLRTGLAGVLAIGIVVLIGMHINTNYHIKQSYNTISIQTLSHQVAPTLKRDETPVAIAPATVFNKISKDMSDVPNSNAFVLMHTIQAQYYQGKPVYIVPIQFRGFFQYQNNHGVIPGYFMISATNPNAEPHFVKTPIYYSDDQYFQHNVNRLINQAQPWLAALSDTAQLEIDNTGHPYYVKTMYHPDVFSNRINYRRLVVAVVNATDGQVKFYRPNDSPKFIDENLTSDAADTMNNDFGFSVHGYWNTVFGQKDIKKPTENGPEDGVTTVFDNHGTISYLSDFTSTANSTNSALGYSMINARTGQLSYYPTTGIMDTDGAIDNADRNYHAQNFHAEMPVLYSIDGHATWVMSILDSSGLQRGFYYVDGANPSVHANGDTVTETLDAFRQQLVNSGVKVKNTHRNPVVNHHGTVSRVFVSTNGTALFTINNQPTIYQIDTSDYRPANLMRPGDVVQFETGGNGTKNTVTNFVDNNLK